MKTTEFDSTLINEKDTISANNKKKVIGGVVVTTVLLLIARSTYINYVYVETDNAKTSAHSTVLATKVGGNIEEILVNENESVKKGRVIFRLDRRDYRNKLQKVESDLKSLQIRLDDALRNFKRMKDLYASDTVSKQTYEASEVAYLSLQNQEQGLKNQLELAKLELEYTELRAPTDGKVGKRNVEKGTVIGAGQPLVAFVQSDEFWVVANFKETQLQDMKIGQQVKITVDAIGGKTFLGTIDSFAPGSGATFAVIPADNATGNFVKIVQRVPVKIVLDKESMKGFEDKLVPGLSVIAKVKVK